MDQLKQILSRVPFEMVAVVYAAWMGWGYYQFESDPMSEKNQMIAQIQQQETQIVRLQKSVDGAKDFFKQLEVKKEVLRTLSQELGDLKGELSDALDLPGLLKMIVTEGKKVGLNIVSVQPITEVVGEFYFERPLKLEISGVYVQVIVFLNRLAELKRILRVRKLELKPSSAQNVRFVDLTAELTVSAFRYARSKADDVAEKAARAAAVPVPTSSATPQSMGTPAPPAGGTQ